MLNKLARLLLTGTALAPVGLTYAWAAYIQGQASASLVCIAASGLLILFCVLMLNGAKKHLPVTDFTPASIEAADHENTAFLLLYVMPLFTDKFDTLNWHFWIPTVTIFAVITELDITITSILCWGCLVGISTKCNRQKV